MQTDGSLPAPFRGGIDSAMNRETTTAALALVCDRGNTHARNAIASTLSLFGAGALRFAADRGISVMALERDQTYNAASPALARLGVDVDQWPAPPAGLFVVEERRVYLRSRSPMTIAHEFGHALDCALGNGVYYSSVDPRLRRLFMAAKQFVTPYAASAIDEYFAEAVRAYVEVNDEHSRWPRVSKARLKSTDAPLYAYVDEIFGSEFTIAAA